MLNPNSILALSGDTLIGCCLIAFATAALVGLVLWSRKRINAICDSGPRSARLILHDLKHGTLGEPNPDAPQEGDDE